MTRPQVSEAKPAHDGYGRCDIRAWSIRAWSLAWIVVACGCVSQAMPCLRVDWSKLPEALEQIAALPCADAGEAPTSIEWFRRNEFPSDHFDIVREALQRRGYHYVHADPRVLGEVAGGHVLLILAHPVECDFSFLGEFGRESLIRLWRSGVPFGIYAGNSCAVVVPRKLAYRAKAASW